MCSSPWTHKNAFWQVPIDPSTRSATCTLLEEWLQERRQQGLPADVVWKLLKEWYDPRVAGQKFVGWAVVQSMEEGFGETLRPSIATTGQTTLAWRCTWTTSMATGPRTKCPALYAMFAEGLGRQMRELMLGTLLRSGLGAASAAPAAPSHFFFCGAPARPFPHASKALLSLRAGACPALSVSLKRCQSRAPISAASCSTGSSWPACSQASWSSPRTSGCCSSTALLAWCGLGWSGRSL